MARLIKTITPRGKHPLTVEQLAPCGIYSAVFIIPIDLVPEWQAKTQEQWGIVQLDAQKRIRRSWNVAAPQMWSTEEVELKDVKIYPSTQMERQFADISEEARNSTVKLEKLMQQLSTMKSRIHYYETNAMHRLAERFNRIARNI